MTLTCKIASRNSKCQKDCILTNIPGKNSLKDHKFECNTTKCKSNKTWIQTVKRDSKRLDANITSGEIRSYLESKSTKMKIKNRAN